MIQFKNNVTQWPISNIGMFILSLIFALSYTQAPLFSSNQNTYFVHGLAQAGVGFLRNDWLANTLDPFPLFSMIVYWTAYYLHVKVFYLLHIVILCIYFYSMSKILFHLVPFKNKSTFLIAIVIMIIIHSFGFSFVSHKLLGKDFQSLFTSGVAGQDVLGPIFQPSIFGVFLILSLSLFLSRKTILSIIALSIAACFHANYFLPASVITVCYIIKRKSEGLSILHSLGIGLLALFLVSPILIYDYRSFAPTSAEHWGKAMYILEYIRTPHHSRPEVWFGFGVVLKIVMSIGALYLIRRTRIFTTFFTLFLVGIILTLVAYIFKINTLSHLIPWRISVVIVPISALILISRGVVWCAEIIRVQGNVTRHIKRAILVCSIIILIFSGVAKMVVNFRKFALSEDVGMIHFVDSSRKEGDVYLVPRTMERFRIEAGVPIVADWKSHPYSDYEIINWYERVTAIDSFYRSSEADRALLLHNLHSRYGVTHVVLESTDTEVPSGILKNVYGDNYFRVYKFVLL